MRFFTFFCQVPKIKVHWNSIICSGLPFFATLKSGEWGISCADPVWGGSKQNPLFASLTGFLFSGTYTSRAFDTPENRYPDLPAGILLCGEWGTRTIFNPPCISYTFKVDRFQVYLISHSFLGDYFALMHPFAAIKIQKIPDPNRFPKIFSKKIKQKHGTKNLHSLTLSVHIILN